MGGYGSGRRKSEEREHLVEGWTAWTVGSLHHQARSSGHSVERCLWMRLNQHKIRERIEIVYTPCHYGGARPWFVCPGCEKRKGTLYVGYTTEEGRKELRCRTCYDLRYAIQNEDFGSRRLRQSGRNPLAVVAQATAACRAWAVAPIGTDAVHSRPTAASAGNAPHDLRAALPGTHRGDGGRT